MQNSQFWGKNDALPSFALYFTVTTFWNVLELNKKKGIQTAADTDQSGFSFCNEFALEFLDAFACALGSPASLPLFFLEASALPDDITPLDG